MPHGRYYSNYTFQLKLQVSIGGAVALLNYNEDDEAKKSHDTEANDDLDFTVAPV